MPSTKRRGEEAKTREAQREEEKERPEDRRREQDRKVEEEKNAAGIKGEADKERGESCVRNRQRKREG